MIYMKEYLLALQTALALALVLCDPCCTAQEQIDFRRLDAQLFNAITNKVTPDEQLLEVISRLGRVRESTSFWAKIADDRTYPTQHRMRSIFALLRRHCQRCGTCAELRSAIAPAAWVRESRIEKITYVFGSLPMAPEPGQTVFRISVLYGPAVYIRLLGEVDDVIFSNLLRGEAGPTKLNPTIAQLVLDDGYDDWILNNPQGPSEWQRPR
jgi:hypothetical protein